MEGLANNLNDLLLMGKDRNKHKKGLARHYPFPEKNPAEKILEVVLADLK